MRLPGFVSGMLCDRRTRLYCRQLLPAVLGFGLVFGEGTSYSSEELHFEET